MSHDAGWFADPDYDDLGRLIVQEPEPEPAEDVIEEATTILETFPSMSMVGASRRQTMWEIGLMRGYL